MEVSEVQRRFEAFIAAKGLRRTPQRDAIVRAAFEATDHFTAEDLWERTRRIDGNASRATVYRTLALLVESGLLREIDLGRDNRHYDPNFLEHPDHNHLICVDCDRVVEFEDDHITLLEDCISKRLGFTPSRKSIRIEANCEEFQRLGACSRARNEEEP
ncbi:MAG TPA: transcriptional repressor [Verrucomicrobiales bacterium]|nr:transcriptional repressor [Verrucomicrobiales bacterium]